MAAANKLYILDTYAKYTDADYSLPKLLRIFVFDNSHARVGQEPCRRHHNRGYRGHISYCAFRFSGRVTA
jgi:hypothetical protein